MKQTFVADVLAWIEELAPRHLAEEWDRVGLQCGLEDQTVARVLVTLTVGEEAIETAKKQNAELIVAHHPLIFKPLESLSPKDRVGFLLYKLVQADIAFIAAHTNLDKAQGGVNDGLALRLGLQDCVPLIGETTDSGSKQFKLVTFVPEQAVDDVREALASAGAGIIGTYSHCTFGSLGEGTFRPLEGSRPHIGSLGQLERVAEIRLEVLVDADNVKDAVSAAQGAHPYEEVPIDLYPLVPVEKEQVGLGRIGELPSTMNAQEFVTHIKNCLSLSHYRVAGDVSKQVRRVAVVGGSGGSFVKAAHAAGADALVTGDVGYHDADEAAHLGLLLVDAGHYGTEKHVTHDLASYIRVRASEAGCSLDVTTFEESERLFVLEG